MSARKPPNSEGTKDLVTLNYKYSLPSINGALKMNPHVVMSQPQMVVAQHQSPEWQSGLLDCFNDCGVCVCGLFCPLCLGCQIASDMGECCLCGLGMPIRAVYRTRYGIPGSLMSDFFATLCCQLCSACQLKRDINIRRDRGIF